MQLSMRSPTLLRSSPVAIRVCLFVALSTLVALSYLSQLGSFNNARIIRATTNFETKKVDYCLQTAPARSAKSVFGSVRFSAKARVGEPYSTIGLLIGSIGQQQQGQCFRATLRFSPGFESSKLFFVAKLQGRASILSSSKPPSAQLRAQFLEGLRGVSPDAIGLVAGLGIGDTSKLSPELISDFKVLSLTHLTAVSGTNCAIVLGLVWFLVARLRFGRFVVGRWLRLCLASVSLWGYVLLVGNQPSVLRAGCMTLAVLLAKTLGRGSSAMNALALACGALLIYDPWLAFDYGFWLSALACIGILTVAPALSLAISRRLPWMPKWLVLAVAVSFSAQLLCFAVLLMLQPGFSTYSIVANLLAEPLVLPITVLALLAVIAAAFSPQLVGLLSFVASLFAWLITLIAAWLSRLPATTGFWPAGVAGVALAACLGLASIGLAIASKSRRHVKGVLTAVICLCLAIVFGLGLAQNIRTGKWANGDWFIASCNVGQGDATVIRSQGRVALVDVGRDPQLIDSCLKQLHIQHLDLLELTHFDLDHVGGLAGVLPGRSVSFAMLTPFKDARPGANDARDLLDSHGIKVELAETGLEGNLGAFRWQVLSPHAMAPEASDSNDGSITMLWRSKLCDVITLADLGEKGQMRLAAESDSWLDQQLRGVPLIMKVSHHGSADQYPPLIEALHPQLALISVGKGNSYGHPTQRTLNLLETIGAAIERTDQHGSISVALQGGAFTLGFQGEQGKTG